MDERVAPLRVLLAVRSLYVIAVVPGLVWLAQLSAHPRVGTGADAAGSRLFLVQPDPDFNQIGWGGRG